MNFESGCEIFTTIASERHRNFVSFPAFYAMMRSMHAQFPANGTEECQKEQNRRCAQARNDDVDHIGNGSNTHAKRGNVEFRANERGGATVVSMSVDGLRQLSGINPQLLHA